MNKGKKRIIRRAAEKRAEFKREFQTEAQAIASNRIHGPTYVVQTTLSEKQLEQAYKEAQKTLVGFDKMTSISFEEDHRIGDWIELWLDWIYGLASIN
jgi:hypothetical protein